MRKLTPTMIAALELIKLNGSVKSGRSVRLQTALALRDRGLITLVNDRYGQCWEAIEFDGEATTVDTVEIDTDRTAHVVKVSDSPNISARYMRHSTPATPVSGRALLTATKANTLTVRGRHGDVELRSVETCMTVTVDDLTGTIPRTAIGTLRDAMHDLFRFQHDDGKVFTRFTMYPYMGEVVVSLYSGRESSIATLQGDEARKLIDWVDAS